jgi:hypothetical protein
MAETGDLVAEATEFFRYLQKHQPVDEQAVRLYCRALAANPGKPSIKDQKLLTFIRRHPWSIGFIDSGLAIRRSSSEVRRRLYVMFSILETRPNLADDFLPQARKWWYIFIVVLTGVRAVFKSIFGVVLVAGVSR